MKKHLIIFSLIFSVFISYAQEVQKEAANTSDTTSTATGTSFCPHRINLYLGYAIAGNIYNRMDAAFAKWNWSSQKIVELKYAYFFNEHWGLSLGVGLSKYYAKGTLNMSGVIENYDDPGFTMLCDPSRIYDLHYSTKNLVEKQHIWALEVPLEVQYENKFGGKNGIYAGLGFKGYFPFMGRSKYPNEGTMLTEGWETYMGIYQEVPYENLPGRFGEYPIDGQSSKLYGISHSATKGHNLRCSFDVVGDIGGIFTLSKSLDLYLGIYGSYGFLNILPKEKYDFINGLSNSDQIFINENGTNEFNYGLINSTLSSDILSNYNNLAKENNWKELSKWRTQFHNWTVGLKIGFHIKACSNGNTGEPSMRDLKRKFYEEMAKKAQDPIIIKNTEYVYIVPTCPEGYEEDDQLSPSQKNNIKALALALSNIKILFDLDKDIPKYSDSEKTKMKEAADILKKDKSLKLQVEGYTCDLGSEQHNRILAQKRANAVKKDFETLYGVNPDQILTKDYTVSDSQNKNNIPDKSREEHRAAIFRIIVD